MKNARHYLGQAPAEEDCAQLGQPGYDIIGRAEADAHVAQLYRFLKSKNKEIPEGFKICVAEQRHDFGVYFEVVCAFADESDNKCWALAWLLDERPGTWDDEARATLKGTTP